MDNEETCTDAAMLAENLPFKVLLLNKILICIAGILALSILLRQVGVRWLVNKNASVIWANHVFWMMIVPFSYLIIYAYDIYRLSVYHTNPCEYRLTVGFSLHTRIIIIIAILGQIFTMFLLALERVIATILLSKYERIVSSRFGHISAIIVNILCVGICYATLLPGVDMGAFTVAYSSRNSQNSTMFQLLIYIETIGEVATILMFHVALYINQYRLKLSFGRINHSYQIKENRRVLRILIPVFWVHFIILFLNSFGLSLFPLVYGSKVSTLNHATFLEFVSQLPCYTLLLSLILNPRLTPLLRKDAAKVNVESAEDHFKRLEEFFNQPLPTRSTFSASHVTTRPRLLVNTKKKSLP